MPKQIHILFNLLALFVISYIVVDAFYRVVEIKLYHIGGPETVTLQEVETRREKSLAVPGYTKIVERNIFGSTEKVEEEPVVEEVKPLETLEETSLQLSLQGTIAGDTASARAIILDQRKRSQDIYRIGDSVQEAEIRQILRGKVILRHGGKDEILTMVEGDDKPEAASPTVDSRRTSVRQRRRSPQIAPGNEPDIAIEEPGVAAEEITIPVEKDVLEDSLDNLNDLMTQVRVRPYFRRGKPEGLIVSQIQSGSVFAKLGLMNGDIIANVNGRPMSTPEEAFQFYNSLKSGENVNIEITRRGQKKMFTYDIQ